MHDVFGVAIFASPTRTLACTESAKDIDDLFVDRNNTVYLPCIDYSPLVIVDHDPERREVGIVLELGIKGGDFSDAIPFFTVLVSLRYKLIVLKQGRAQPFLQAIRNSDKAEVQRSWRL